MYIRPGEVTDVDFPDKRRQYECLATVAYTGKSHIGLQFYRRRFSENELSELYAVAPVLAARDSQKQAGPMDEQPPFCGFWPTYLRAPIHAPRPAAFCVCGLR